MAVKTVLTAEALAELCMPYGIGRILRYEGIARGTVQTNYHLFTDCGEYTFRLYENRTPEQAEYEIALLTDPAMNGFPVPKPVRGEKGYIGLYEGKPYALFGWLPGHHAPEWNTARRESAARMAAELAKRTAGLRLPHEEKRLCYTPETLLRLAEEAAEKSGDGEKLRWYRDRIAMLELPEELPRGVCHGDYDLGNLFFEGGRATALLDFDDANSTLLLFDPASMADPFRAEFRHDTWQEFAPDADVTDLSGMRTVVSAYESVRPMTECERAHLFDAVQLSILTDCVWYFGRGALPDFYEKRKLEALDAFGRERFRQAIFGCRNG